ncbi:MAG TPA: hypothetical protein VFP68_07195 [Burkholderiaceae bacterium]|nr:hypothetical protein [Burkholderiaceae bacterium]
MHDVIRTDESSARALALIVAANGRVDERKLAALDRLDAFRRLGVSRERFVEMARTCLSEIGPQWCKNGWLHPVHAQYIDALLHEVRSPRERLLVCRFAAAVMVADGRITTDERIIFTRALGRWGITQTMVSHAIMKDSVH